MAQIINVLSEIREEYDFTSGLWTFLNIPLDVNICKFKYSKPFTVLNGRIKVKFGIIGFTFDRIYLLVLDREKNQTVHAKYTLNIMDNDNKSLLKICDMISFNERTDEVVPLHDLRDTLKHDSVYKLRFIITVITVYEHHSTINCKCVEEQKVCAEDIDKRKKKPGNPTATLVSDFDSLFTSQKFSDFLIKVHGEEIAVYKGILASRNAAFCAMLEKDFSESKRGYVEITDLDKDTVFSLIRFLYTSEVIFSSVGEAQNLFRAADKYEVSDLKCLCEKYILDKMNVSNVVDILIFTNCNNAEDLKARALKYAVGNFKALNASHIDILGENDPRLLATLVKEFQKQSV